MCHLVDELWKNVLPSTSGCFQQRSLAFIAASEMRKGGMEQIQKIVDIQW